MENNINFETFLLIGSKKLTISVKTESSKTVYNEEMSINKKINDLIFDELDFFLNDNIFKIEKKLNNFVKKVNVIIDMDVFFPVEISLKKNNYENIISTNDFNYLLNEAKDCCKKTIDNQKIIHMIINSYHIDNKIYFIMPKNISANSFSLDIKFICISDSLIRHFEKILEKYQISLDQIVSASYINEFLTGEEKDIFILTKKIIDGYNPNEVFLVEKSTRNKGFFEKFFDLFS